MTEDQMREAMLEDAKEDVQYDIIVLIQTFEHVSDPVKSIDKITRLLKDDGLLFIEVPNFFSYK